MWKSRQRSACCQGERDACRRMGMGGVRRRWPCSEDGQALEEVIKNFHTGRGQYLASYLRIYRVKRHKKGLRGHTAVVKGPGPGNPSESSLHIL